MPAIHLNDLSHRGNAHLLEGQLYGDVPASLVFFDGPPGSGAKLHRHPYAEVFAMQAREAVFTAGDDQIEACPGQILIAPAGIQHKFVNCGDEPLRVLDIHLNGTFTQWNDE